MCGGQDFFLCLLAILFPPIAVWVKRGLCSADSLINIALCILGFIPGLLHAWYIVSSYPSSSYQRVRCEENHAHVHYVSSDGVPPSARPRVESQSSPNGRYGTMSANAAAAKPASSAHPAHRSNHTGQTIRVTSASIKPQEQRIPTEEESGNAARSSERIAPPAYSEVVQGDNKIQS